MCGFSVLLRLVILVGGALLALVGSDLIHLKVTLSYTFLDHLTPFILEWSQTKNARIVFFYCRDLVLLQSL